MVKRFFIDDSIRDIKHCDHRRAVDFLATRLLVYVIIGPYSNTNISNDKRIIITKKKIYIGFKVYRYTYVKLIIFDRLQLII